MTNSVYQLIYCSRNIAKDFDHDVAAEMAKILDLSRHNNTRDGLTGALLYSNGAFAQVLEGPMSALEIAFERIQCDPRHNEITVIRMDHTPKRAFGDWSMAHAGQASTSALTGQALSNAIESKGEAGAATIIATIQALMSRETEWVSAPH